MAVTYSKFELNLLLNADRINNSPTAPSPSEAAAAGQTGSGSNMNFNSNDERMGAFVLNSGTLLYSILGTLWVIL